MRPRSSAWRTTSDLDNRRPGRASRGSAAISPGDHSSRNWLTTVRTASWVVEAFNWVRQLRRITRKTSLGEWLSRHVSESGRGANAPTVRDVDWDEKRWRGSAPAR